MRQAFWAPLLAALVLGSGTYAGAVEADVDALSTDALLALSVQQLSTIEGTLKAANHTAPCSDALVEGWDATTPRLASTTQIDSDTVFLVTHSSTKWDKTSSSKEGVNRRVQEALLGQIPTIYLVHSFKDADLSDYFLRYRPTYVLESNGGDHRLKFRAKNVLMAGGYFDVCSGETARDVILGWDSKEPIRLTYLTDAVYIHQMTHTSPETLKEIFGRLSDAQAMEFLHNTIFSRGDVGVENDLRRRSASLRDYTLEIFRDGRRIGSVGTGKKRVEMNFLVDKPVS